MHAPNQGMENVLTVDTKLAKAEFLSIYLKSSIFSTYVEIGTLLNFYWFIVVLPNYNFRLKFIVGREYMTNIIMKFENNKSRITAKVNLRNDKFIIRKTDYKTI